MENDIFWDVFRDTGDPLCWLMTRGKPAPEAADEPPQGTEDTPSAPA